MSTKTRNTDSIFGRVVDEFTDRFHRGENPRIDDYAARHPDIADELQQVLAAVEVMSLMSDESQVPAETPSLDPEDEGHLRGHLGDFRIVREIGRGGMGVVYEAEEISLGRHVALKLLPFAAVMDPRQLARFRTEAQAAAILQHPHIVAVYGVGCERGVHYYAMQYIKGTTLAAVIEQLRQDAGDRSHSDGDAEACEPDVNSASGPTGEIAKLSTLHSTQDPDYYRSVARLGIQAAEALDHAHASGVLHRDIKPGNLMLDARGNLWITDFGLARIDAQAGLTLTGDLLGTPRYMSPEQALGKRAVIDHRSDVYSLGATLYELLTLTYAVPGENREEILNHIATNDPRPLGEINPAIPTDLTTIVQTALAKSPDERYDTAIELADDLKRFLNYQPIRAQPPTLRQRLAKWSVRHKSLVAAVTTTLLFSTIALALATIFISRARTKAESVSQELRTILDEKQDVLDEKVAALTELEAAQLREAETARAVYPHNIRSAHEHLANHSFVSAGDLLSFYREGQSAADRRSFEWYYLWNLIENSGARVLRGHTETVFALCFSPDSRLLATASSDDTLRIWDTESGQLLRENSEHTDDVNGIVFSPDGDSLATASDDRTIVLWDTHTGMRLGTFQGHTDLVQWVQFSPDGQYLASGAVDGELRIWERSTKQVIASVQAHDDRINAMAISPDGQQLATASRDGTAKIWSLLTLAPIATIRCASSTVETLIFDRLTGNLITNCGGNVTTWDGVTGRLISERTAFGSVLALAMSRDGRLAISGHGRPVIVRHPNDLPWAVYSLGEREISWCVAFSPDGRYLAAGRHHDVALWDLRKPTSRQILASFPHGVEFVAVSPDSQSILMAAGPDGALRQLDIVSGQESSQRKGHPGGVTCGCFSPDGRLAATGGHDQLVRIWESDTGRQLHQISGFTGTIADIDFSGDGQLLSACDGTRKGIWNVGRWHPEIGWWGGPAWRVAFSFEKGLVSGGPRSWHGPNAWGELNVCYEALIDGQLEKLNLVSIASSGVPAIQTSPGGRLLAVGTDSGSIGLFAILPYDDPAHMIRSKAVLGKRRSPILSVAFSPCGRTLATADSGGAIDLWDVKSGTNMLTFRLKEMASLVDSSVFTKLSLDFARDGTALVAGAEYRVEASSEDEQGLIAAWFAPRFDQLLSNEERGGL